MYLANIPRSAPESSVDQNQQGIYEQLNNFLTSRNFSDTALVIEGLQLATRTHILRLRPFCTLSESK